MREVGSSRPAVLLAVLVLVVGGCSWSDPGAPAQQRPRDAIESLIDSVDWSGAVVDFVVSPDGSGVASVRLPEGSGDEELRVVGEAGAELVSLPVDSQVEAMDWSADTGSLWVVVSDLFGGANKRMLHYDTATGEQSPVLPVDGLEDGDRVVDLAVTGADTIVAVVASGGGRDVAQRLVLAVQARDGISFEPLDVLGGLQPSDVGRQTGDRDGFVTLARDEESGAQALIVTNLEDGENRRFELPAGDPGITWVALATEWRDGATIRLVLDGFETGTGRRKLGVAVFDGPSAGLQVVASRGSRPISVTLRGEIVMNSDAILAPPSVCQVDLDELVLDCDPSS